MSLINSGESVEAVAYALMQTILEIEAKDDSRWFAGNVVQNTVDANAILSLYARCLRVTRGEDDMPTVAVSLRRDARAAGLTPTQ